MNWQLGLISFLPLVFLSGCGTNSASSLPTAPTPTPNPTSLVPAPTATPNPNLPDLTNAQPLQLPSYTGFSGMQAVIGAAIPTASPYNGTITTPVVGDPLVKLILSSDSTTPNGVKGTARFELEDANGAYAIDYPSFPGTGTFDGTNFTLIYADGSVVILTSGTVSSGTLTGTISYRARQSSDPTLTATYSGGSFTVPACEEPQFTCTDENGNPAPAQDCGYLAPNTAAFCTSYMATGQAGVISLGSFTAQMSQWLTN